MGILKALKRRSRAIICLCAAVFPLCLPAAAQESLELYEQKIKAGLFYNFLKYTDWPDTASQDKIQVCLFGGDSFEGYLAPLQGRTAQQSVIEIKRIDKIDETQECNVVFVHQSRENSLSALLSSLQGKHILTISDIRKFASQGGMVEMSTEGEKVNLYINQKAVNRAGLDIQDRMLRLAKLIPG